VSADPDLDLTAPNPLHQRSAPVTLWTTVNAAENIPGLMTPLGAEVWLDGTETGVRGAFAALGVLGHSEITLSPRPEDRFGAVFFGRFACNVDRFRWAADLTPGGDGAAFEEQMLGSVREGIPAHSRPWRLPIIAACAPRVLATLPRTIGVRTHAHRAWWRAATSHDARSQPALPRLHEGRERVAAAVKYQMLASFVAQGLFDALGSLARRAGRPEDHLTLMTAYGDSEESEMVAQLQDVADGRLTLDAFLTSYGARCPGENELSARSWREDSASLERLTAKYRDARRANPRDRHCERVHARQAAERRVLDGLPSVMRIGARLVFWMGRRYIPLREEGKATLALAMDATRAAARDRGRELHEAGLLADVDDVFYLTYAEVAEPPAAARNLVAERKALRVTYGAYDLPQFWTGNPELTPFDNDSIGQATTVEGMPAAAGTVDGYVRVLGSADEIDDIEPDEILVCRTTDPSWGSAFHLVAAVVIDIGGPASHGAIIAREMGLPCVINTRDGTRRLRTGDHVRVDGSAGLVTIIEPAAPVE
jgi:phosphohistidine swiveling domain-containing protein